MIRRLVTAVLVTLGLLPSTSRAEDAAMTLDVAVTLALARNERALKAPRRIEAAQGGVERARAAFLPTIVGQGVGGWTSIPDRNGRDLSGVGTLTVGQPLLNPSAFPLYAQAKHALFSEEWGAAEDLRVLAFDTTNAFLTALSDEQLVQAAMQRRDRAKSDVDDAAARAQAGLTTTNDVTRAAVAVATAETQLANSHGTLDRSYLQLSYLVGQNITGGLVPPTAMTENARTNAWTLEQVIHEAEARRPDVRSAAEHTASLHDFADEPLYRLAPTLGVSGQLREAVAPVPPDQATSETAQLTLTWTIYDAGVRYADRRTRLAQAESAALDERALRRSVATDISVAIAGLRAAREVYDVSLRAVSSGQKNSEETAILYKQGLAKAIEVTDANATLYDAEVTRTEAALAMEQAYLNLRYALGLGPLTDALPAPSGAKRAAP